LFPLDKLKKQGILFNKGFAGHYIFNSLILSQQKITPFSVCFFKFIIPFSPIDVILGTSFKKKVSTTPSKRDTHFDKIIALCQLKKLAFGS